MIFKVSLMGTLISTIVLGQWITGYYSAQNGVLPPGEIPWGKYTHIIHFAAAPDVDKTGAGNGRVALHYLTRTEIKAIAGARRSGSQLLVCLKDNDHYRNAFAESTLPNTIRAFVGNIAAFVEKNRYDGVDIDWEKNVNVSQYADLITRLRLALGYKTLTIAVGDWEGLEDLAARVQSQLDQINVMCYDMDNGENCNGVNCTWHNGALLQAGESDKRTCDSRIRAFTAKGVANAKIGVGIPFYGRRQTGASDIGVTGTFPRETIYYRDLVLDPARWQSRFVHYDEIHKAEYLSLPELNEFVSYNGVRAVQDAVEWQKKQGFGGISTFPLEAEYLPDNTGDARYPLSTVLAAGWSRLRADAAPADSLAVNVRPNGGSGTRQTFVIQVSDPHLSGTVQQMEIMFGAGLNQPNGCRVQLWAPSRTVFLRSDSNTAWLHAVLGGSASLRNSQCGVNVSASSFITAGKTISFRLAMTFATSYAGSKTISAFAADASGNSTGWQNVGSWTIPQ